MLHKRDTTAIQSTSTPHVHTLELLLCIAGCSDCSQTIFRVCACVPYVRAVRAWVPYVRACRTCDALSNSTRSSMSELPESLSLTVITTSTARSLARGISCQLRVLLWHVLSSLSFRCTLDCSRRKAKWSVHQLPSRHCLSF